MVVIVQILGSKKDCVEICDHIIKDPLRKHITGSLYYNVPIKSIFLNILLHMHAHLFPIFDCK